MPVTSLKILKEVFGYQSFRQYQQEIIESVLQKKDTLVIMPTGGGKSICYQIPALIFEGLTVVVSPLISLMKDQVSQLNELGVAAVVLNSSISKQEYSLNVQRIERGEAKLLYVAPETLLQPKIQNLLQRIQIDCITVDEAHCISEWGHDFRPEYRQIAEVRQRFPQAACIALTATATPRVQRDIKESLGFPQGQEFVASFDRENLLLQVIDKSSTLNQTLDFLKNHRDESGIIYCFSRNQVDELAAVLQEYGYSALPYHAGLDGEERARSQEKFIRDDVQIIVATVAFGMGINKSNVRFVIHYDLPKNIESYYQEIGRAGRDGLPAECLLFLGYGDIQKIRYFFNEKPEKEQQIAEAQLQALVKYAEFTGCRRQPLLQYFGQEYREENCNMCDNCRGGGEEAVQDVTVQAQKFISCVKRTGEIFGALHIADVLRGSKNQKIRRFGHDRLSTYDIGAELTKKQWIHLSKQLVRRGYLRRDEEQGSLRVLAQAQGILSGAEPFVAQIIADDERPRSSKRAIDFGDYDRDLFDELRKFRKNLAEQANLPPYVVFSDKSLVDMAATFPQTEDAFLMIHGVGAEKNKKYGKIFRDVIKRHCLARGIEQKSLAHRQLKKLKRKTKPRKHMQIGEAFNQELTLEQLATENRVQIQTVIQHLLAFVDDGHILRHHNFSKDFPELDNHKKDIAAAFARHGDARLSPIFKDLHGKVSWELLKLFLLQQKVDAQEQAR